MKISKLTTDAALDVLCEITPYATNIVTDEKLMEIVSKTVKPDEGEEMTRAAVLLAGAEKLTRIVPLVMKDHREDVYGILSAVNGKSPEEIARQNVIKTSMQIRDICKDRELWELFTSCAQQGESE